MNKCQISSSSSRSLDECSYPERRRHRRPIRERFTTHWTHSFTLPPSRAYFRRHSVIAFRLKTATTSDSFLQACRIASKKGEWVRFLTSVHKQRYRRCNHQGKHLEQMTKLVPEMSPPRIGSCQATTLFILACQWEIGFKRGQERNN